MPKLTIDFQTGFTGDDIEVEVNGVKVASRPRLKTSLLTGFAGSVEMDVDPGNATVEVSVPRRGLRKTIDVHVEEPTYLGISIEDSQLTLFPSTRAFGYA